MCRSRLLTRDHTITSAQPLQWPAALPCLKSKAGEEAATPGQPVALSRVSGSFPLGDSLSRITAAARSPQSSGRARNHHVSLEPNLFQFVASRNIKENRHCEEAVEDETSLWKVEENLELLLARVMRVQGFQ